MKSRSIKAVIFDMDGVITHTMPYHVRAWMTLFHKAGIPVTREDIYAREGQKGLNSVREISALHGKPMTQQQARELLHKKETLFKEIARTAFVPGARRFVKKCRSCGYRLGLVTGTSRHEVLEILPSGLRDCFDVLVTGSDVRHGKPHPEPYRKALRLLKVKRGEAVVIENAPFGIASAKAAGLVCLALKTSLPASYLKRADKIFSDYEALETYLYGSGAHPTP